MSHPGGVPADPAGGVAPAAPAGPGRGVRLGGRQGPWVLADQALVSGSNFLFGIVLARSLGPEAFGAYVLLQAVLLYVNSYQGALLFQPLLSTAPQLAPGPRRAYLRGAFALQLALAAALAGLTLGAAVLAHVAWQHVPGLQRFGAIDLVPALALALAIFGFQLQDWCRRLCFIARHPRGALLLDALSSGLQGVLLAGCAWQGKLDVATALTILGGCTLAAGLLGCSGLPGVPRLRPDFGHAVAVLRQSWRHGRDYLVAWQFQWAGSQGVLVVGAGLIGAEAAGGVRAAQNLVGPINLLFQTMENVVPIAAARAYVNGGATALARYLGRISAWGSALLLPLLMLLTLGAAPLTDLLYGPRYAEFAGLVGWQALAIFLQFHLRQRFFFLRTVLATGAVMRAGVLMALCAVLVAILAVPEWGATGVMASFVASFLVGLLVASDAVRRWRAAPAAVAPGLP